MSLKSCVQKDRRMLLLKLLSCLFVETLFEPQSATLQLYPTQDWIQLIIVPSVLSQKVKLKYFSEQTFLAITQ